MELALTPLRMGLLLACLVLFAVLGGFTSPAEHLGLGGGPVGWTRAWIYCVVMFLAGAVGATVVDHWIGLMAPTSLRPIYVAGGVLLMVGAILWYRSLLSSWEESAGAL